MKRLLCIISLLINNLLSFAQIDYIEGFWDVCEPAISNYIPSTGVLDSRNGYWHSPHGQIRFLMAFIELDYSNPNDDPTLNETNSDVQEGDFDGAFTLAQTLPSLYRMDGDERLLVEDIAARTIPTRAPWPGRCSKRPPMREARDTGARSSPR